jgi:urea carboxylase
LELSVRILHLPMAFNDARTNAAVQKYMRSSRSEGPYLPSNVDFVAANNGIAGGAEGVAKLIFDASYMVLGLGDVYLGAPCAVPVDPRYPPPPPPAPSCTRPLRWSVLI